MSYSANNQSSVIKNQSYRLIASAGQASTQTPQSTQLSALTFALPSTMLIAVLGHSPTQVSQPVHFSGLTSAGISKPFHKEPQIALRNPNDSV
jgi:hypothetical protein